MADAFNKKAIETKLSAPADDPNAEPPGKIVIPDECGDALWEEVLKQQPTLTTQLNPQQGAVEENSKGTTEKGGSTYNG